MPEGPDGKTIIIVKKVSGHGGHHGGAWKVAFADFVTAMMALFMVLWLVNSASVTTRERIASYFREPGVFEKGSGTPLEEGGAGILTDAFSPPADENSKAVHSKKIYKVESSRGEHPDAFETGTGVGEGKVEFNQRTSEEEKMVDIGEAIEQHKKQVAAQADKANLPGSIEVKIDQRGLHIEIMDTDKASMFELGSARINEAAEQELVKIAKILSTLPNPIDIEGHTDGRPFNDSTNRNYDNWNLSSDRAHVARRVLIGAGIKPKQIARVVGYSDQRLKVPSDPLAAANRRISISMRFTELASKALDGTKTAVTEPRSILPADQKAAADAGKAGGTPAATSSKGLTVEVGTTLPDGPVLIEQPSEQRDSTWTDKDKIFGNKNPFFPE